MTHRALPAVLALSLLPTAARAADAKLDFNRDIRPILTDNCLACHGPDEKKRKADLRLDDREVAVEARAIVPGKPDASELLKRLTATDPGEVMPPPKTGKTLTKHEVRVLTEWVRQGAPYADHWSYVKPERPPLSPVRDKSWPRNGIDHFIPAWIRYRQYTDYVNRFVTIGFLWATFTALYRSADRRPAPL